MGYLDQLSPQQIWDKYNIEFPDHKLELDHIGLEIKSLFVYSPMSNSRDEHTKHLSAWIWKDENMRKVGVGVMKYDNWVHPEKQALDTPEQEVEIHIDPAIRASVHTKPDEETNSN